MQRDSKCRGGENRCELEASLMRRGIIGPRRGESRCTGLRVLKRRAVGFRLWSGYTMRRERVHLSLQGAGGSIVVAGETNKRQVTRGSKRCRNDARIRQQQRAIWCDAPRIQYGLINFLDDSLLELEREGPVEGHSERKNKKPRCRLIESMD